MNKLIFAKKTFVNVSGEFISNYLTGAILFIASCLVRSNGEIVFIDALKNKDGELPQLSKRAGDAFVTYVRLSDDPASIAVGVVGQMSDKVKSVIELLVVKMKEAGLKEIFMPAIGDSFIRIPMTYLAFDGNIKDIGNKVGASIRGPVFFSGDKIIFAHGSEILEVLIENVKNGNWTKIKKIGDIKKDIAFFARANDSGKLVVNTLDHNFHYEFSLGDNKISQLAVPGNTATFFTYLPSVASGKYTNKYAKLTGNRLSVFA